MNEYIQNLENLDGNFSQIGMWKLKSKLMPRGMDPPMGKFDVKRNLITAPNALMPCILITMLGDCNTGQLRVIILKIMTRKLHYGK